MTKPLDPEIKALQAIDRAIRPLNLAARERVARWLDSKVESERRLEIWRARSSKERARA